MIIISIVFICGGIAILLIGAQSNVLWAITLFIMGGFFLYMAGYTKQEKSKSVETRDMQNLNQHNQDETIEKRLDNLNDLKNRGIITEEEYEKQRKNIIDSI